MDSLTDEEIATANTTIILDSECIPTTDSLVQDIILTNESKKSESPENEFDSQSTYISFDSLPNNTDDSFYLNLSDINGSTKSTDNVLPPVKQCDAVAVMNPPSIETNSNLSPLIGIVQKHISLSSTPILQTSSIKLRRKHSQDTPTAGDENGHSYKRSKGTGGLELTHVVQSSRKRCHEKHHDSSGCSLPEKEPKLKDANLEAGNEGNKSNEYELHELAVTLKGSIAFVVDKATNKLCSAQVKQLSIAEDFDDVPSLPPLWHINHRLSGGSGSDLSGNLADRSMTSSSAVSSTVSLPGPFELIHSHSRCSKCGTSNIESQTESTTSSSLSKQNGARYLDQWHSAAHLLSDNPIRSSLLKMYRSQHLQLSCVECSHTFPPLELSSGLVYSPLTTQSHSGTPDLLSTKFGDERPLDANSVPVESKVTSVPEKLESKEETIQSYQSASSDKIERVKSENNLLIDKVIPRPLLDNSSEVDSQQQCSSLKQGPNDTCKHMSTNIDKGTENRTIIPSTSKGDSITSICVNYEFPNDSSFSSDSEIVALNTPFSSPFIDTEDLSIPDNVKGKAGPNCQVKGSSKLSNFEDESTICLGVGIKVPRPPTNSNLFENCNFLFTNTKANWKPKTEVEDEMKMSGSATDSEMEDASSTFSGGFELTTPDLVKCKSLITIGGGRVYQALENVPLIQWPNTYLIANHPCRTKLYLQCLAAGITRLSPIYIVQTCIKRMKFTNVLENSFPLPTGWSQETDNLISEQTNLHPLNGYTILLALDKKYHSSSEIEFWKMILNSMSASVITQNQLKGSCLTTNSVQITVTNRNCSAELIKLSEEFAVPLVSCNWIIHTLIHGEFRKPSASSTYLYSYLPED